MNRLARRGELQRGSDSYGKAFENWVFHELSAFIAYRELDEQLTYWRLPSGIEVDFVVGDMRLAIEAKASVRITSGHLRGPPHTGGGASQNPPTVRRVLGVPRPPDERRHRRHKRRELHPTPMAWRSRLGGLKPDA